MMIGCQHIRAALCALLRVYLQPRDASTPNSLADRECHVCVCDVCVPCLYTPAALLTPSHAPEGLTGGARSVEPCKAVGAYAVSYETLVCTSQPLNVASVSW
jgi:hypothetical protein